MMERLEIYRVSKPALFGAVKFRAFWFLHNDQIARLRLMFGGWNYHLPVRYLG